MTDHKGHKMNSIHNIISRVSLHDSISTSLKRSATLPQEHEPAKMRRMADDKTRGGDETRPPSLPNADV